MNVSSLNPFEVSDTKIFRPRIIKNRIGNQSDVFSVISGADLEAKIALNYNTRFASKLIKVKVPSASFEEIRIELNSLGVNAFSIFPDLSGLCAHLQWQYFSV